MDIRVIRILGAAAMLWLSSVCALAGVPDPSTYPRLDDKQLGHVNRIIALAHQLDGDWSGMGSTEPGQEGDQAYRYQLAFMAYALSVAQFRFTPAYRELYEETDNRLIHKMLRYDVWSYWELTSRGVLAYDSSLKGLGAMSIDPVAHQDIMYSGHLFMMVTLHQMLYGDDQYARPGGVTFSYRPIFMGAGPQSFVYDTHSLATVLYKQFRENDWRGIACEPNAIFPECNQHPILAFALYDHQFGTHYFHEVSSGFKKQFAALHYIDPETSSFMSMHLVKQKITKQEAGAWSDGWAGAFMHAWDSADIEQVYPRQKARFVVSLPDGTMTVRPAPENSGFGNDHGFFTIYAAEVGDRDTANKLLTYADKYWSPAWVDGQLIYPRNDQPKVPGDPPEVWRNVGPTLANGLLPLARMVDQNALYNLFNRPFDTDHFKDPFISDVSYPAVEVPRAIYDRQRRALVITLRPGAFPTPTGTADWTVLNLKPNAAYSIWTEGKRVGLVARNSNDDQADGQFTLARVAGGIRVKCLLKNERSFVIAEE